MDLKSNEFKGVNISIERNDIDMLRLFLENGASVELAAQHAIKRLCSIKNCEIAKRLLELSRVDKNSIEVETSKSEERVRTQLKFNKTMLCLIEVCQSYDPFRLDDNVECDEFFNHMNLYEKVIAIVNSKKKDITDVFPSYHTYVSFKDLKSITSRNYYVKLVEIIEYIVDNYLQNTLKHIEYNELGNSGCGDVEILNDRHYDIVKSDLANQNFEMLKLLIEYGMDINSYDSLILRTAYKAGDIGWINYFISKGAKFSKESDGLEEACKSDKVVVLERWIRNGGVVPKNPEYPCINMACSLGNSDMVKLLVESGVDISDPERNGVRISCRLGLWRILDYLILAVTVK
ncbi:putative ankyrin repeat protein [Zancudomyces culisetae]|uniref:Putative ankyrin repeat protein n=1 Tax=Zancudomyces culisetae TaxID=1213189 RepID=A0A1R1PPV0_ZANCU|nr:putative ankyrin repeat protein [Zancudomyces culisetae]|eukprot:OMH82994.1 putative ankyrin repeat protein [Zancudomyces culisetae]